MSSLVVIGAGAWGTALAIQAARAGTRVTLWVRDPARARALVQTRENPRLPGVTLPPTIHITAALSGSPTLKLLAVPLQSFGPSPPASPARSSAAPRASRAEPACSLSNSCPSFTHTHRSAFSPGPNFAAEVAAGQPAAAVIATTTPDLAQNITAALGTPTFRLYPSTDPLGAQLGAAAKNVIAIAAGAAIGAGLGQNARAALITRGLAEIARLSRALGGRPETLMGLAGLGDLLLTCTSETSRNYRFGLALGRGQTPAEAQSAIPGVIEGVATAPALIARAGDIELPICRAVAAIVAGQITTAQAQQDLLSRLLPPSE